MYTAMSCESTGTHETRMLVPATMTLCLSLSKKSADIIILGIPTRLSLRRAFSLGMPFEDPRRLSCPRRLFHLFRLTMLELPMHSYAHDCE